MPTITASHIDAVRARAVAYRYQAAIAAGAPAGNLAERIDIIPHHSPISIRGDGWCVVGMVHDSIVNQSLRVLWHPETDRVRVGRPIAPAPEPERGSGMPALSFSLYGAPDYWADPDYRYFLDGREYTPADSVRIATERNSAAGWTWERRADESPISAGR